MRTIVIDINSDERPTTYPIDTEVDAIAARRALSVATLAWEYVVVDGVKTSERFLANNEGEDS